MGVISVSGPYTGSSYRVQIAGDTPTVDEQMEIDAFVQQQDTRKAKEYEARFGTQLTDEGEGVLNYLGEIPKGIARGAVGGVEAAALAATPYLPESIFGVPVRDPYREGIRSLAYGLKPQADVGMEETVGGTFGEALGSFAPLLATAAITRNPNAVRALASAMGAGEATERAIAEGATIEEQRAAGVAGAGVGLLGAIVPLRLERALGKNTTLNIVDRLRRAAVEGGIEGATEAAENIAQNLIEQGIYNPAQGTFVGTGESFGYGAGVGAFVKGLLDLLPGGRRTAPTPAPQEETAPPAAPIDPADLQTQLELPLTPSTRPGFAEGQEQGDLFLPTVPAAEGSVLPADAEPAAEEGQLSLDLGEVAAATPAIKAKPTDVPKATVTEAPKALVPSVNEAVAKADIPAVDTPPEPAPQPKYRKAAEADAAVLDTLQRARAKQLEGSNQLVSKKGAQRLVAAGLLAPEDLSVAAVANAKVNELLALGPDEVKLRMQQAKPAKTEVADVPEVAAAQPEEVGAGAPSGGQGVEGGGRPADDTGGTTGIEAPASGGLGRSVPMPVGPAAAEGEQPAALTEETQQPIPPYDAGTGAARQYIPGTITPVDPLTLQPVGKPYMEASDVYAPSRLTPGVTPTPAGTVLTGSPTEMQIRDAEKALAPMAEIREVAANSAAQSELEAAWTARMADKPELASLIDEYSVPDAVVLDDPTTSEDKRKVLGLFQPGAIKKGKAGSAPAANAQEYFSRFKRPIDALEFIVADATLDNQRFKNQKALEAETGTLPAGDETISPAERAFFSGMTQERAKEALKWVEANMSPQAQAKVRDLQRKYRKAQEAKVPMRATSTLPSSTAIGGRAANAEERAALEQELTVQAQNKAAQQGETKRLVSLGGQGLEALLARAEETKAPIQRRAVGMRKMTAEDQIDFVADQILGLRFNRPQEVLDIGSPLHPAVVNQLRRGNLELALRALQLYAPNDRIKRIVRALAPYAQGTSVQIIKDLRDADGAALVGQYRRAFPGKPSEILLDEDMGLSIETLLHEMTHAATISEMRNEASPLRKRMEKLFNDVKPMLSTSNGTSDVMEFIADAFSVPSFQQELASLYPNGGPTSALGRIANDIMNLIRRLVGLQPRQPRNALDITDQMVMQMLDFPVSPTEISTPEEGATILNRVAQVDGSFPGRTKEFAQQFGDDASGVLAGASWGAKRTILGFMGMQPLADVASHYKIDGAQDLQNAIQQLDAAAIKSDQEVDGVLQIAQKWARNNPNLKPLLDRVITRSTVNQVDPSMTREKALKKYGADSDKMRMYDTLQKDWAAIGKDGRDLYNNMRQLYRKQYERLREALSGKIDFILSSNPELAAEVKKSIYTKFFDMNRIEPYFPLARKGDYWLEYSAFDPETGTTEPVKEAYESPRARDRAAKELESMAEVTKGPDGKPIFNYYSTLDVVRQGRTPDSLFVRDTLSIIRSNLANTGVDAATASSIQQEITRLFVDALPETSFAKSLQRRKNTRGYIEDSLEALRVKGYSLGRQGVRYAYSNKIRAVSDAIQEQAKFSTDANKTAVIEELAARANFATNPPADMFERMVQTVNRGAFTFTIGLNVSSALVNLSSVPVVLYPYLSGRYGPKSSAAAIGNAYKLFLNSGLSREIELPARFEGQKTTKVRSMPSIDNYFVLNSNNEYVLRDDIAPELRPMLQELAPLVDVASKNGQLNRSIYYDSIGAEDVGRARNFGDRFAAISGAMFHQVERANRQVALVAAYNLELDRLRNKPTQAERNLTEAERRTRAAERAVYQATETGGGATLASAPRWAQKGIGRVALMFKNYGLSMFYLQMKLAKQLTLGSNDPDFTPEDRRTAFKQLVGLQLSSFALAGIAGMPLYGLASTVADAFLGDDEEDADMLTRRYLGEGLYKGFLSDISGLDISSRIGLTGLLIRENRYNTDPSAEETLVANLGGPAWSTATQLGRGVSEFYKAMTGEEGDMVRGIENMVPAAVRNFIKAGRYLSEGGNIETRRKDIITGDLGSSDLLGQALGFTPTKATLQQDINQLKVRVSNAVAEKRSRLSKLYYIALREGDIEGAREVLEDIRAFNEDVAGRFPDAVIDKEFLKRSLESHKRTSKEMLKGVSVSPAVREGLVDLEAMYNQGFQLF